MARRVALGLTISCLVTVLATSCGTTAVASVAVTDLSSGARLEQFGLRARCADGDECNQRALEAFMVALSRLGPEVRNSPITSPGGAPAAAPVPPDRLYVEIWADPMLEWHSSTGAAGSASAFRVDLTNGNPYVVVAPRWSFRLTEADAAAIRDALFVDA